MRKTIVAACAALLLAACAVTGSVLGPTPESQIVNGNNVVNTAVTLVTTTLRRDVISVAQAESYRDILKTAHAHMKDADSRLRTCRKKTLSNAQSNPDPCRATVGDDIELGLKIAKDVHATLERK